MNAATQAHTVPKFYLRGFVAPEPKNGLGPFVWFGSLTTGEVNRVHQRAFRSPQAFTTDPAALIRLAHRLRTISRRLNVRQQPRYESSLPPNPKKEPPCLQRYGAFLHGRLRERQAGWIWKRSGYITGIPMWMFRW